MGYLEAVILGLVQGLTEFLPISSSAHLRIVGELLHVGPGNGDPGARFTAIIQLGTELAVLVYFFGDIVHIIASWFKGLFRRLPQSDPDVRMGWFVIVGSIPIVVLGLLFQDQIETVFRSLWIVATTLIVFGILLGIADAVGSSERRVRDLTWPHAILYGLAQALALVPGVSRSGGTITMGRFLGYDRAAATRFSFLLALPAVFGSGLYELYKSIKEPCVAGMTTCTPEVFDGAQTAVATVVAGIVGFVVIAFLMRYISKRSYLPFVIYRVVIGVVLVVLLTTGVIAA
ncbi:undecaprenyl-diphosphate phosphatase [Galbitalea sp. SE-J8]|uniref:undecaprenyl-diphosphate phosphatase n=1 Tax=Galbitalea sp. SE-J8 TaxID=3054952 RepID=UPI00259CC415|nr:undecaprenyl-diphosphate phosphatase [Galbitalea sp. SE-J8]MDM4763177.1 undecaprenyl-diphosphate phosphatase [Galbitalea sp. SE-J8]